MIASHEQITTMAAHYGLTVKIEQRKDRSGSQYDFYDDRSVRMGGASRPASAKAWLHGFAAGMKQEQRLQMERNLP